MIKVMDEPVINTILSKEQDCATLLILVSNSANEKLVRNVLAEEYDISSTNEVFESGQFDLLITDEPRFRKYSAQYKKIKHQAFPVMLPILLLARDRSFANKNSIFLELVDDILSMPTSPYIIRSRIKLLLKTRSYSKQLQIEKKKYQLLAENSTDLISIYDSKGEYTYASPSSEQILGYEPEELIERNSYDFVYERDHEAVQLSQEFIFSTKKPCKVEFRTKTKKGEL